MREINGNIWDFHGKGEYICVTTNGIVKANGELVMGAGIALEAKQLFPKLPIQLGRLVKKSGNVPFLFEEYKLITFPTKHDWKENSILGLIKSSAEQIVKLANQAGLEKIYLTRPGCGKGNLQWDDVKPVIENIFDWRFVVVSQND